MTLTWAIIAAISFIDILRPGLTVYLTELIISALATGLPVNVAAPGMGNVLHFLSVHSVTPSTEVHGGRCLLGLHKDAVVWMLVPVCFYDPLSLVGATCVPSRERSPTALEYG